MKKFYNDYLNDDLMIDKQILLITILLIVVISGVTGFIYEYIFYYFNGGMSEFYWRGGGFLPWINIYAIGALLIWYTTSNSKKKPFKVFIITMATTGLLEYLTGLFFYKLFNIRFWDYNTEILNFMNVGGFICLRSLLMFGFMGLLLMYLLLPCILFLVKKYNSKLLLIISITLFSLIILDKGYNGIVCKVTNLPSATDIYSNIGIKFIDYNY